jgi:lipoprotein-anchoring transpeptidase ErfK/SrfK
MGLLGLLTSVAAPLMAWGCTHRSAEAEDRAPEPSASITVTPSSAESPKAAGSAPIVAPAPTGPRLAATDFASIVYAKPSESATRLGYLRVGAKVERGEEPASTKGCKGGWFEIQPRGFLCNGKGATVDLDAPLVRAAARVAPNLRAPLPYRYGFVRAVVPMYLGIPTKAEQLEAEFKLEDHLTWYEENREEVDRVELGAHDVPVDDQGVVVRDKQLGELGTQKNSLELGLGQLFGGDSEEDEPPFWLTDGKRTIPNISGFDVPDTATFADRSRRFTGLAFIGSFSTGPESLGRRFAITTDLRVVPTTKIKPDTASPFHGVELTGELGLPLAFVRQQGATAYALDGSSARAAGDVGYRQAFKLTGKFKKADGVKYLEMTDGRYLHHQDVGLALAPAKWPKAAEAGEKWIEIAAEEQVLVLWEGKKAVYATLVSSGRKKYPTETGTFRIFKKHISATMDSDQEEMSEDEKSAEGIAYKGDGEYGVTKRRGQGTYQLKDVPYIQYFNRGQALHAAYWHDVFGKRRSHGCVNLAPVDAHRIFMWTEPAVPTGWHGVNAGDAMGEGTVVIVHE